MALSAGFYELRLKSYKNLRSQLCKKYANYARNMLITVKTKKKLRKKMNKMELDAGNLMKAGKKVLRRKDK